MLQTENVADRKALNQRHIVMQSRERWSCSVNCSRPDGEAFQCVAGQSQYIYQVKYLDLSGSQTCVVRMVLQPAMTVALTYSQSERETWARGKNECRNFLWKSITHFPSTSSARTCYILAARVPPSILASTFFSISSLLFCHTQLGLRVLLWTFSLEVSVLVCFPEFGENTS